MSQLQLVFLVSQQRLRNLHNKPKCIIKRPIQKRHTKVLTFMYLRPWAWRIHPLHLPRLAVPSHGESSSNSRRGTDPFPQSRSSNHEPKNQPIINQSPSSHTMRKNEKVPYFDTRRHSNSRRTRWADGFVGDLHGGAIVVAHFFEKIDG